jgi:hypothetical protein
MQLASRRRLKPLQCEVQKLRNERSTDDSCSLKGAAPPLQVQKGSVKIVIWGASSPE